MGFFLYKYIMHIKIRIEYKQYYGMVTSIGTIGVERNQARACLGYRFFLVSSCLPSHPICEKECIMNLRIRFVSNVRKNLHFKIGENVGKLVGRPAISRNGIRALESGETTLKNIQEK